MPASMFDTALPMFYLLIKALLLPPGIFVLAGIICLLLFQSRPRVAGRLLIISTCLLYALSTLFVSKRLAGWVEPDHPLSQRELEQFKPQAIVLLGADRINASPEYGGADAAGGNMLIRMRYAANLHRNTRLPVLVSGGPGYYKRTPQAEMVGDSMEQDFGIPVAWRESRSLTTWENASYSRDILLPLGVERVLLVTQAFHMARAEEIFNQFGFQTLAAPTGFMGQTDAPLAIRDFYPELPGFQLSSLVLHEIFGLAYYRLRGLAVSAN